MAVPEVAHSQVDMDTPVADMDNMQVALMQSREEVAGEQSYLSDVGCNRLT